MRGNTSIPLICLMTMVAGCYLPPNSSAVHSPVGPVRYFLPVRAAHVRLLVQGERATATNSTAVSVSPTNLRNHDDVAAILNEQLDSLCSERNGLLRGPGRWPKSPGWDADWQELSVYLDDPGPMDEPWKSQGLARIAQKLGTNTLLVVRPRVELQPVDLSKSSPRPNGEIAGRHWQGRIIVTIQEVKLAEGQVLRSASGESDFSGNEGVAVAGGAGGEAGFVAVIPYAFGKSFSRAAEQASRKALTSLLADRGSNREAP